MSAPSPREPRLAVALETSTRRPSVAARHDGRELSRELTEERAHASDLLAVLAAVLAELGARARDVELVAVGVGPGSYTGLRVGIAAALGLARGASAALAGVPSGEALAFERLLPGERAVQLLDARGGELYLARYERVEQGVRTLDGPRVVRPEELALPPDERILGDATVARAAQLDERARALLDDVAVPSARAVLALGLARFARGGGDAPEAVRPLYLRPFSAQARRR